MASPQVSIIVVTYNALFYCWTALQSLTKTEDVDYEVIVVDNNSRLSVKLLLFFLQLIGRIQKLLFVHYNSYYTRGNNLGVSLSLTETPYVLILNPDIKVVDNKWLSKLLSVHKRGATAYGVAKSDHDEPKRGDGFCILIDRDLFLKYQLDEFDDKLKHWWSISKLQAQLLQDGFSVQAVTNYEDNIIHYGGKSGGVVDEVVYNLPNPQTTRDWFEGVSITEIDSL